MIFSANANIPNKGLVNKKCELNCSFVDLLSFVVVLFRDHP